jgi:hypothetical protein
MAPQQAIENLAFLLESRGMPKEMAIVLNRTAQRKGLLEARTLIACYWAGLDTPEDLRELS